jgi:hypothetical protein
LLCHIVHENILVSRKKIDVPIKTDAKPRLRLVGVGCVMGVEDGQVYQFCNSAKERRIILNRVSDNNGEAYCRLH